MRANDWMDTYLIPVVQKPANFKHTLDHLAREWYDSLVMPMAWNDLQQQFSRYFSTQARSIKHLHDKWRNFSFTPGQDDIEAYIRDIKEAAHQLNYNDDAVLHLIKATMPAKIYGTLYNQDDLNVVVTMVKDIYAKKPEPANPPGATGGSSAPFTLIKAPNRGSKRVHFQADESLSCKQPFSLEQLLFAGFLVPSCLKRALVLENGCERFCASRSLLGSYVHQESI